jgi:ubiquinone/menaquinone biosynthesis C-methylase UbiE
MATVGAQVTTVDLNTVDIARARRRGVTNVSFIKADLNTMALGRQFDVVVCIGVIHHCGDPDAVFDNLYRHCRPGGLLIVWTYSAEGNGLIRFVVEPARKLVLRRLPRAVVIAIAHAITLALYPIVHGIYRLPLLSSLPYYAYFGNFRRLAYARNVLNVFGKLNAPQTRFTTRDKCATWMSTDRFEPATISIRPYLGVSYSLVGRKRR